MSTQHGQIAHQELPDLVGILAEKFKGTVLGDCLSLFPSIIYSLLIVLVLCLVSYFATRKKSIVPERLQCAFEILFGGLDDFVCGIIGPKGRKYTPFIGTLFIYILFMNIMGIIPLMKSPSSLWSNTLALALCVFFYVQYTALREMGFLGYIDHLLGKPRGVLAFSVFIPLMIFFIHVMSELIRPISLSLRLRSNIWGDDMLLSVLAGFGLKGVPLLLFSTPLVILAAAVQAAVFCLLSTVYFALVLSHEEDHSIKETTERKEKAWTTE